MYQNSGIAMEDVTGATVSDFLPAAPDDLIESLNAAARRPLMWPWVLVTAVVLAVAVSPLTLLVGVPAVLAVALRDRSRRVVVVFYEVDGPPAERYTRLVGDFAAVTGAQAAWHRLAQGALHTTHQQKVHGGASSLIRREALIRTLAGPPHLACNIAVPTLRSTGRSVYFFPDRALIQDGSRYASVGYDELTVSTGTEQFIEDGKVPSDATIVGSTWQYVNKNGCPDRRFKNNRQLPVVRYGEVVLASASGVTTILSFSRFETAAVFASSVGQMRPPSPVPAVPLAAVPSSRRSLDVQPPARSVSGSGARASARHRAPAHPGQFATAWTSPPFPPDAAFVAVSESGRRHVRGESKYQPALAAAAGGRAAGYELHEHLPTRVVLVPEPSNPFDSHAVRVDVLGPAGPETVGYLPREEAPDYHEALAELGTRRFATCAARITGGGSRYYGIYLWLADPVFLSLGTPKAAPVVTLPPVTACTVTGEEKHQDDLRRLLGDSTGMVRVVAQLGWCTIASGKYAGRTAVEVSIDGARVGQLTYAMSCRYADLVRAVERTGQVPTAEALVDDGPRGVQVELRLPRVAG